MRDEPLRLGNTSNFPCDLVGEVLLRLPADTLANLRRVSKSWRDLIDSPEFIRSHLRENRCSGRHSKFMFHTCNKTALFRRPSHYTTAGCPDSPDTMEATKTELECPLHIHQFSGSCNGLICAAAAYASDVVLLNPCTNQHKILPPADISCHGHRGDASRTCYGFGHDVGRDDYKVVKLVQFYVGRRSHLPSKQEIKIYSLKSDSWRNLVESPYFYPKLGYHGSVFVNGALHWLMADVDDSLVIMGLNLTTEKYHLVPQPKDIDSDKVFNWGALDDCLCLMVYGDSKEHAQMWKMKQYGVRDSWTKMSFRLPYFSSYRGWDSMCCKPIACSGKILLFLNYGELMWYNTEDDKLDQLKVFSADSPPTLVVDGYAFTGSLVNIDRLC